METQIVTAASLDPTTLTNSYWRMYTAASDPHEVADAFTARYGEPPARVVIQPFSVLAGPIPAAFAPDIAR